MRVSFLQVSQVEIHVLQCNIFLVFGFIYVLCYLENNTVEKNTSCLIVSWTLQELLRLKSQGLAFQEN